MDESIKSNEVPEKLYFGESDKGILDIYSNRESNDEIEYTRTDSFIEKAEEWLRKKQKGFILTDKDIIDFVNDMKEG